MASRWQSWQEFLPPSSNGQRKSRSVKRCGYRIEGPGNRHRRTEPDDTCTGSCSEDSAVGPDHLVIAQIAALDLGRLTPLEAINLLYQYQDELKETVITWEKYKY